MRFRVVALPLPVPITAQLYAAIDAGDGVTWTDDSFYAVEFDTSIDATDFATSRIGPDGWKVQPIC